MPERERHPWRVVRALVQAALESGGRHRVTQVAAAIAYALLVTLAPLLYAYSLLHSALMRVLSLPSESPVTRSAVFAALNLQPSSQSGSWLSWAGPWLAGAIALFGASAVFSQYVGAVALVWDQPAERSPIRVWIRSRLLGLLMLIAATLPLTVASLGGSLVAALAGTIEQVLSRVGLQALPIELFLNARFVFGFIGIFALFSVSVFVIPLDRPRFCDVWPGLVVTSAAYVVGDVVLGVYLRTSSRFTEFGGFGSIIGSLVWVYYSVLIVLYGAELTRELDRMRRARRRTSTSAQ